MSKILHKLILNNNYQKICKNVHTKKLVYDINK
jgi:hypothetical protein